MCALGGWVDPFLSSQRSPILHGSWKELDHLFTSEVPLIHCRWEEIWDKEAQALLIAQLEEASTRAEALKVPSLHRHQHRKRPSSVVKPWGRGTGCKGGVQLIFGRVSLLRAALPNGGWSGVFPRPSTCMGRASRKALELLGLRAWEMSCSAAGTRVVQKALEVAASWAEELHRASSCGMELSFLLFRVHC